MEENAEKLEAVTISADKNNGEVNNEMAVVSVRTFSVEETDRYAVSRWKIGTRQDF